DFSSVMEVHGGSVEPVGEWWTDPTAGTGKVRFGFDHPRFCAATQVSSSVAPTAVRGVDPGAAGDGPPVRPVALEFLLELEPHETWETRFEVAVEHRHEQPRPAARRLEREPEGERSGPRARVAATWPALSAICDRSLADLDALRFEVESRGSRYSVPAAGVPWYLALIGRDMIWTGYEALPFAPELAEGALHALADLQATEDEPDTDAEPGKILHELRFGKLTALGEKPYRPYYGTVDATPLFLILLSEHWRVTGDDRLCHELRPQAMAALGWLGAADLDGDGLVEYRRRAPSGARNQCWKDSEDSIRFAGGRMAEGAVAVCEVQGYAYAAELRMAEVAAELWGDLDLAGRLQRSAAGRFQRFNERFWIERRGGYYALALDGDKRQVDSLTSNLGHLLWSGIVPEERAEAVASRLVSPALASGWGLRTMSTEDGAYNPISYHNGSVWPHDTAIAVAGLTRYGRREQAGELAVAMLEAAARMEEHRLPEVFSGHGRDEAPFPVWYAEAASPQGWASAAPLLLVRSVLGLDFERGVARTDPCLPERLEGLTLEWASGR
ncbi:MAG TPA: amylo-alpha-1,6-glucosidase, partial [Acidimicrobiales bacterium]|nr:amylo-alpha-1,6-glucosidase [Acidimicrobiales bacterium]